MSKLCLVTGEVAHDRIPTFLEQKLKPRLPFSLALYRRCQYHFTQLRQHGDTQNGAEVWVAVASIVNAEVGSLSPAPPNGLGSWLNESANSKVPERGSLPQETHMNDQEWLAAHIDLSNPGETQVWLFASWEPDLVSLNKTLQPAASTTTTMRAALLEQFYNRIRLHHVPKVSVQPTKRWQSLLDAGKLISVPYDRRKVLMGAVSEHVWPYIQDYIVYGQDTTSTNTTSTPALEHTQTCRTRQDLGYLKYIVPPTSAVSESTAPPSGFRFASLSDQHLQLMLDRSAIPRTLELLQSLVSVGLFPTEGNTSDPIAWGLLSKDGSFSSLHTEDQYRGRGLAEHVCRQLGYLQGSVFNADLLNKPVVNDKHDSTEHHHNTNITDYSRYLHADVSESNVASRRVFEKLGGTARWKVGWIEVNMGDTITHNFDG